MIAKRAEQHEDIDAKRAINDVAFGQPTEAGCQRL